MKFFFLICCLVFLCPIQSNAQAGNNFEPFKPLADSLNQTVKYKNIYGNVLDSNIFLNSKAEPQSLPFVFKTSYTKQSFFYLLVTWLLLLGILRTIFNKYFLTMFRVFFNTSLRQNQLTDQLEQATLPSLLFNLFFAFSAGLYIYFLHYHFTQQYFSINWNFLGICFAAVVLTYFLKYMSLLFIGWATNYLAEAKIYIFIVFLFNKIIGILLIPFILLMVFSSTTIAGFAIYTSFIFLALLLITRFYKTYNLLQNKLKINFFHFALYIVAFEILPFFFIYKLVLLFFANII